MDADVLAVVEAENRPALSDFDRQLLTSLGGREYRPVMLIDGNHSRAIDVGLLAKKTFPIERMRSHVDDCCADGERIFSRDRPEFEVALPAGATLWVLVNHLKSKGYGSPAANDARRQLQARRVAEIYPARHDGGQRLVAVLGDSHDTPAVERPAAPAAYRDRLRDVFDIPSSTRYPGTYYGLLQRSRQLDYVLLSPALFQRVRRAGAFARACGPGCSRRDGRSSLNSQTPGNAAFDDAAVRVDLDM